MNAPLSPIRPPTPQILIDPAKVQQLKDCLNEMPYDVVMEHLLFTIIEVSAAMPFTTDGKPLKIEREGYDTMPYHRNIRVKIEADRP